jgi:enterochelin esterase-like enzyme
MRILSVLLLSLVGAGLRAGEPLPSVPVGRIERIEALPSKFVAARNIDVWLPPGYDGKTRCAVVYLHDGQTLYDPSKTWMKQAWNMAQTTADLIGKGEIPPTILVGIWNTGASRHSEYFPEKTLEFLPKEIRDEFVAKALQGKPRSDAYLRFLVEELKPLIDSRYATLPDQAHTIVMGSSMGGIISLYAMCEYPDVFGAAGCLSTHWLGIFEPNAVFPMAAFEYLQRHLPSSDGHKLYMDRGDKTLDTLYPEAQSFADVLIRAKGYDDKHFVSRVFPGANHSETSWASRVALPLVFLDGK